MKILDWLREHDPGYAALRRAARTALVMPAVFAFGDKVIGNPALATFGAFGSFAMLLLVDFSGPMQVRLMNQAALGITCAVLISIATLASRTTWLAVVAMTVVAFAVLFAAVVSSVLAGSSTTLLLAFILPVSLPGNAASIPDRVAGWGLAAAASIAAIALLWPAPTRNPVRATATAACRALAARLRAEIAYIRGGGGRELEAARAATIAEAAAAVERMERSFFATPYRPGGLSTEARAGVRLVDELRWLNAIVLRARSPQLRRVPIAGDTKLAVAEVLDRAADRVDQERQAAAGLQDALDRMHAAVVELEKEAMVSVGGTDDGSPQAVVSALDPSFRAREMSFVAALIATNAERAAAALERSWFDRLLGRQPKGSLPATGAARLRAGAHLAYSSQALRNSVRGAAALGLSVLVADVTSVQHGFWVSLGTLAVLRSNALSTGQDYVRALAGTAAGFLVGGALVYVVGTNTAVLWALLPVAILFAGLAPAAISFVAGQAGFTLTLLILFNLIAPAGWQVGLVRIEDVALGGAVSLLVGLLFWPRGAAANLGQALAGAYDAASHYLNEAVAYAVGCCDSSHPSTPPPDREAAAAAEAVARLDDAFRGYLTERGSKAAPLAEITGLVTGATGVGLAADGVLDLWNDDVTVEGDRSLARDELLVTAHGVTDWYEHFASSLDGLEPVPAPLPHDEGAGGRLIEAVARDLRDPNGTATATGVRVIWTGDHLDAARQLQDTLVQSREHYQ